MRTSTNAVRPLARAVDGTTVSRYTRTPQRVKKVPPGSNTPTATPGTRWLERRCIVWSCFDILHPLTVLQQAFTQGFWSRRARQTTEVTLLSPIACSLFT